MMRSLKAVVWVVAISLIALPIIAVVNGWIAGERWPMRRLVVTADFDFVSEEAIRSTVAPLVRRGFFAVNLPQIKEAVSTLPWVSEVEVRKRWPDRLEIVLTEHKPLAHWGQAQMISESGEIFPTPDQPLEQMPHFEGPVERVAEIIDFYVSARSRFTPVGRDVQTVQLSARGGWTVVLDNGLELVVGRDASEARVARFANSVGQIQIPQGKVIGRADLRYTNGFAISWQDAPLIENPTTQAVNPSS